MTTRYIALTVLLEREMRDDDAERLIDAILMLRGVMSVSGEEMDITNAWAEEKARQELVQKLHAILYPAK